MTDPVTPALTLSEWEHIDAADRGEYSAAITAYGVVRASHLYYDRRHALAALALHGQPFGPTWEMVDGLREVRLYRMLTPSERAAIEATLAFVVALLPPRVDDGPQEKQAR